jgi:parallel beta-helix repeat protein
MLTPLHRFNNDMVFFDGRALQSAGWEGELDQNTYSIDYVGAYVYIKQDPTGHLVEITNRDSALVCTGKPVRGKDADHKGPTIRGITFTQYAYRALEIEGKRGSVSPMEEPTDDPVGLADPATFGKEVVGTILEDCTITHCSRVAGYFRGDRLIIRHCLVSDTSTEGIYLIGSSDCLLERNIFERNNVKHLTGYYPAAVKIFNQTRRVVCRENLIIDNSNSNGVWYDVGDVDGVFVNNWVEGCVTGLFFEISHGLVCAGNVFTNCKQGVRILNSRNTRILHNTFVNAPVEIGRNERGAESADHFGWHITTGPKVNERAGHVVAGNIMAADPDCSGALLAIEEPASLRGTLTDPQLAGLDDNLYIRAGLGSKQPALISWAPVAGEPNQVEFRSLAELRKVFPSFESYGAFCPSDLTAALRSPQLQRFELAKAIGQRRPATEELIRLLNWPAKGGYLPGAYQDTP